MSIWFLAQFNDVHKVLLVFNWLVFLPKSNSVFVLHTDTYWLGCMKFTGRFPLVLWCNSCERVLMLSA